MLKQEKTQEKENLPVVAEITTDGEFTQIHVGVEYSYPVGDYQQVKVFTNMTKRLSGDLKKDYLSSIVADIVDMVMKTNEFELNKRISLRQESLNKLSNKN